MLRHGWQSPFLIASPVLPQDRGRSRHPLHISSSSTASGTSPRADRGIYAQDTWTIDRLTINAGVRLEQFQSGNDTYRAGAGVDGGRFIGGRTFNGQDQKP